MFKIIRVRTILFLTVCLAFPAPALRAAAPFLTQIEIFHGGDGRYHTYRIPAMVVTPRGTLLAFCEGRKNSPSDTGDIDTVLKRSFDHGRSWTDLHVIADFGENTIANPSPVVDWQTGTIFLLLTSNPGNLTEAQIETGQGQGTRTVWVTQSSDDGATWSPLKEITRSVKEPTWTDYSTTFDGIQLKSGRLVIPCDYSVGIAGTPEFYHSHVIYSDDHGRSWKVGGSAGEKTNESTVVELADGTLLLNMRSYYGNSRRAIATSHDAGMTWSDVTFDNTLIEPVCEASMIRISGRNRSASNRLLFSNPADTKSRIRMTVRLSDDGGRSWPISRLLYAGPAGYSSLTVLSDGTIGCLYERGRADYYEEITFAHFNLEWLMQGAGSEKPVKAQ